MRGILSALVQLLPCFVGCTQQRPVLQRDKGLLLCIVGLTDWQQRRIQKEIAAHGLKPQLDTRREWHSLNLAIFRKHLLAGTRLSEPCFFVMVLLYPVKQSICQTAVSTDHFRQKQKQIKNPQP